MSFYSGRVAFPDSVRDLMVPLDTVHQHPQNPNNGDLDAISESIRVNGFTTVITVDAKTRQIVAGNHRWQALHALGATMVPALFVDYETEDQARRILIADNQTGQLAHPDEAMLLEHLKDLKDTDLGLAGTGFTDEMYEALLMAVDQDAEYQFGDPEGSPIQGIYEVTVSFTDQAAQDHAKARLVADYGEDAVRTAVY